MNHAVISEVLRTISQIERATSPQGVLERLHALLMQHGLRDILITRLPVAHDRQWHREILCNGWSAEWHARYNQRGHYFYDPCAGTSRRTGRAFFWSELERGDMDPRGRLVMDEAREFGMLDGACVPIHTPLCGPAVVTAAGDNIDLSPSALPMVEVACVQAYRKVCDLDYNSPRQHRPSLTSREREILQWSSEGKGTEDIACILGISRHTVETHIRNIREKLDVLNVTHAVAEALRRQEIQI
ncbi:autoinducer binding domain-containing protein [Mesorhizobium sp. SB112]|uniref:helix-turn-helix transcriptional regulator n=1 Tax=Mesorhizobium sp. SB112 TaxID=3151853 RepID=UPI003263950A